MAQVLSPPNAVNFNDVVIQQLEMLQTFGPHQTLVNFMCSVVSLRIVNQFLRFPG